MTRSGHLVRDEGKGDTGLNVVTRALTVDKITAGVGFLSSDVFIRVMDEFQKARRRSSPAAPPR